MAQLSRVLDGGRINRYTGNVAGPGCVETIAEAIPHGKTTPEGMARGKLRFGHHQRGLRPAQPRICTNGGDHVAAEEMVEP